MHGPHLRSLYYCKHSEALSERMRLRWQWGPKAMLPKHWASARYRRCLWCKRPASGCLPDPVRSVPGLLSPVPARARRAGVAPLLLRAPPSASRAARRLPAAGRGRRGAGRRFRARRRAPLAPRAAPPWPRRGTRCPRVRTRRGRDGSGVGWGGRRRPPRGRSLPLRPLPAAAGSPRALRPAERGLVRAPSRAPPPSGAPRGARPGRD